MSDKRIDVSMYGPKRRWFNSRINDPTRPLDSMIADAPEMPESTNYVPGAKLPVDLGVNGIETVYDRLPSHLLYVGDQLARKVKTDNNVDSDFAKFKSGITPDELDRHEQMSALQAGAAALAAQTADLDDTKFNEILAQLEQVQNQSIAPPTMPQLNRPNDLQLGAAGLAAMISPQNGWDLLAQPFQYAQSQRAQGYEQDKQRFAIESDNRKDKLGFLGQLLGMEDQRSRQRQDADERKIGRQFDLSQGNLERLSREGISEQNNEYRLLLESLKGQNKQFADQANRALDAYYKGKDLEARQRAWLELGDLGFNLPEPTEKNAYEKNLDAKTRTVNETRELTKQKLQSQIGLNNKNAERVSRVVYWMDAEKQASIAKAYKSIEDMQSRIDDRNARRDIDWAKVTIDSVTKTQTSLNTAMSTISAQANSERSRVKDLENKLYSKSWMLKKKPDGSLDLSDEDTMVYSNLTNEITQAKQRIKDLQTQHGELKGQAAEIRRRAEEAAAGAGYKKPTGGSRTEKMNSILGEFANAFPSGRSEQWADRNIAGTNKKSMHATGEAGDLYGDLPAIRKWALNNPAVGMVIHDGQIWQRDSGGKWRQSKYNGRDPHTSHVHVEPLRPFFGPPSPGQNSSTKGKGKVSVPGVGEVTYRRG